MPIEWRKFTGIDAIFCKEYTDPPLSQGLKIWDNDGSLYALLPAPLRAVLLPKMGWSPDNLKDFVKCISAERIDEKRARVIVEFEDTRRGK